MILSLLSTTSATIQAGTLDQSHTYHSLQTLEIIVRKRPVGVDPCPPKDTEWTRGALGAGHHTTIRFDSSHQGTTGEQLRSVQWLYPEPVISACMRARGTTEEGIVDACGPAFMHVGALHIDQIENLTKPVIDTRSAAG